MTEDRLDWHLWNWSVWMGRGTGLPRSRAPALASGGMGVSHGSDFDTMCDTADARCASTVDAIVESMKPAMKSAVHHKHLAAIYRFPRDNLQELYKAARVIIGKGLDRRGIV